MLLAKELVTFIGNELPVGMRMPKTNSGPIGLANKLGQRYVKCRNNTEKYDSLTS